MYDMHDFKKYFPRRQITKNIMNSMPEFWFSMFNIARVLKIKGNLMAQSAKNFEFWLFVQIFCTPLMCREFCTPPIRGDRNSVPLPFEVSGILYPSLRILYPLGPLNNERPLRVNTWPCTMALQPMG